MSDRTWNQIDAKLYEEDWSRGARIVAGVLLARCPNQYGVFDFPKGYLRDLFEGLYSGLEIDAFMQEWEEAGFVKFYRKRTVIWIRSKWKRSGLPSDNHWKGLKAHLMDFPEVQEDFLSYYEPHWKGIQSPSEPPRSKPKPPVNPESESESDKKKEKDLASKSDADIKNATLPPGNGKPPKPYIPIEERKANTPISRLVQQWFRHYLKYEQIRWSGDPAAMSGQAKILLKSHDYPTLIMAMGHLFDKPHEKYRPHEWNFYVRKISTLIP